MKYYCDNKRHLVCIPYSIANLHLMARDLGIGKWWFHNKKGREHYDIPKLRIQEIQARCQVVSSSSIIQIIRNGIQEQ